MPEPIEPRIVPVNAVTFGVDLGHYEALQEIFADCPTSDAYGSLYVNDADLDWFFEDCDDEEKSKVEEIIPAIKKLHDDGINRIEFYNQ